MGSLPQFLWSYFGTIVWGWFAIVVAVLTVVDIVERAVEKSAPAIPTRMKVYIATGLFIAAQIAAYRDLSREKDTVTAEREACKTKVTQLQTRVDDQQQQLAAKDRPVVLQLPSQTTPRMTVFSFGTPQPLDAASFLLAGKPARFNLSYTNVGAFEANTFKHWMAIATIDDSSAKTQRKAYSDAMKRWAPELVKIHGEEISPGSSAWLTLATQTLSQADVDAIMQGRKFIIVMAFASWEDSSGLRKIENCSWMQPPQSGVAQQVIVWHTCEL